MTDYENALLEAARAIERVVISDIGLGQNIHDGRDGVAEWIERSRRDKERIEQLERILNLLKSGDCWCEMGIGNPMVRDHGEGCRMAMELLSREKEENNEGDVPSPDGSGPSPNSTVCG